jgi:hypothetical protein
MPVEAQRLDQRRAMSPPCAPIGNLCNSMLHNATRRSSVQHVVAHHRFPEFGLTERCSKRKADA